jgi:hypothetical protein
LVPAPAFFRVIVPMHMPYSVQRAASPENPAAARSATRSQPSK